MERTVRYAMSQHVVSLPPEAPISQAATRMRARGVNRIPVIDQGGQLVGIVTGDDVIEAVARAGRVARGRSPKEPGPASPSLRPD